MRYLSYVLFPLVAAYSVYTLLYETHRSWYSWILNTLVGAVYTFGFVLMVGPPSACSLLQHRHALKQCKRLDMYGQKPGAEERGWGTSGTVLQSNMHRRCPSVPSYCH